MPPETVGAIIAAAPELLEACEESLSWLLAFKAEMDALPAVDSTKITVSVDRARAAIAKARAE